MYWSSSVLGANTVTKQVSRLTDAILVIGRDRFSRADLGAVKCFNFSAALNLSNALAATKSLQHIKSTADLFETVSPLALVLPRLGDVGLAVLGAAFEIQDVGGRKPLEAWFAKHLEGLVTFHTIKAQHVTKASKRDAVAKRTERQAVNARKHARRNVAHGLRIARLDKQRGAA